VSTLLFVYGTLKRGCCNHGQMAGQTFVGIARTMPGYRLYDLGGYPAIVSSPEDRDGVVGEVWSVDPEGLCKLDTFEGVHEGLYRREPIALQGPFSGQRIDAYVSVLPVVERPEVGNEWIELQ
jgi:gamma-glutamylaminecyclotransferase